MPVIAPQVPVPSAVSRLTFVYDGDQIHLVSEQQVTMIIPLSHPLDKLETAAFCVMLKDDRGNANWLP